MSGNYTFFVFNSNESFARPLISLTRMIISSIYCVYDEYAVAYGDLKDSGARSV
jgi:hypothetical protein